MICPKKGTYMLPKSGEQQRSEKEIYEEYNAIKSHLIFVWHLPAAEAV